MNTPELVCVSVYMNTPQLVCVSVYIEAGVTEFCILLTAKVNTQVDFCFMPSAKSPHSVHTSRIILRTNRDYFISLCDISGSHSGAAEGMSLLGT